MKKTKQLFMGLAMFGLVLTPAYTVFAEEPTTPGQSDVAENTGETGNQSGEQTPTQTTKPVLKALKINDTDIISACVEGDDGNFTCESEVPRLTTELKYELEVDAPSVIDGDATKTTDFNVMPGGSVTGTFKVKSSENGNDAVTEYNVITKREVVHGELKTLNIKAGDKILDQVSYNQATKTYTVTVAYDVREVTIEAEAKDTFVVEEYEQKLTLDVGTTTKDIVVGGEYAERTYYHIQINRVENPIKNDLAVMLSEKYGDNFYLYISEEEGIVFYSLYETLSDGSEIGIDYEIAYTAESTADSLFAEIEKAIAEKKQPISVYLDGNKVTKEVLEKIKDNGSEATIYGASHYAYWTINGDKLVDTAKEFDTQIFVGSEVKEEIQNKIKPLLGKNDKGVIVDFAHNGVLPTGTSVTIYVGEEDLADQKYNLYYYNPNTNKLELVVSNLEKEVHDGFVSTFTIPMAHCSSYVILPATNNAKTGVLNVALYSGIAGLAFAGIVVIARKKNN